MMDTRIALPTGIVVALALGIGFSGLVPTRMSVAESPAWASAIPNHATYEADATWRFEEAPPVNLDPSLAIGPQYDLGEDEMGYAVPASTIDPDEAGAAASYVAVDYGLREPPVELPRIAVITPAEEAGSDEPLSTPTIVQAPISATIY
jgi:hypothetical protein